MCQGEPCETIAKKEGGEGGVLGEAALGLRWVVIYEYVGEWEVTIMGRRGIFLGESGGRTMDEAGCGT